jgi:hypothetical protein
MPQEPSFSVLRTAQTRAVRGAILTYISALPAPARTSGTTAALDFQGTSAAIGEVSATGLGVIDSYAAAETPASQLAAYQRDLPTGHSAFKSVRQTAMNALWVFKRGCERRSAWRRADH